MPKVTTTLTQILSAEAFMKEGINSSVSMEKGEMAVKAMRAFTGEVDAAREAMKNASEAYQKELEVDKKRLNKGLKEPMTEEEMTEALGKDDAVMKRFKALQKEIADLQDRDSSVDLEQEELSALLLVMENAKKKVYEMTQKDEKRKVRREEFDVTLSDFGNVSDFYESLKSAK